MPPAICVVPHQGVRGSTSPSAFSWALPFLSSFYPAVSSLPAAVHSAVALPVAAIVCWAGPVVPAGLYPCYLSDPYRPAVAYLYLSYPYPGLFYPASAGLSGLFYPVYFRQH